MAQVARVITRDKGRRVARFLGAHSGALGIEWEQESNEVRGPHGICFRISGDRDLARWSKAIISVGDDHGIRGAIRFDGSVGDVSDARVGITLRTLAMLLAAYDEVERSKR